MPRSLLPAALAACLSIFAAFGSPAAQAQSEEELAASAPARVLLQDPLLDNEILLVGVYRQNPIFKHDPVFFADFGAAYAVRLTRFGRAVVYQVAIEAKGEIVDNPALLWMDDGDIGVGKYVAVPDVRDARVAETPEGEVLIFAPAFLKQSFLERIDDCVKKQTKPCSFEEATDWALTPFKIAGDRRIVPLDRAYWESDGPQPYVRGTLHQLNNEWTTERVETLRAEGGLFVGGEAFAAAAEADAEFRERHRILVAGTPERNAIWQESYNMLAPVAPDYLLYDTCGRIPVNSVFGLIAHDSTRSAELLSKDSYPACVEQVRASLDRKAYAAVFAAMQPMVARFAELGGVVEPIEGGTGLQISGRPMPHPDAIELPLDKTLATLAGRDFSAFEQDVAYMEAARQRRLERERRQREAEQRAAQAQAALNARILQQQMAPQQMLQPGRTLFQSGTIGAAGTARSATGSGYTGSGASLTLQESGSLNQPAMSGGAATAGSPQMTQEEWRAWQRKIDERQAADEAWSREYWACINDPTCRRGDGSSMGATAQ